MRFSHSLTVAAVLQIGPDDIFLREAENTQSPSSHGGVNCHAGVCNQLGSLIKPGPAQRRPHSSQMLFENFGKRTWIKVVQLSETVGNSAIEARCSFLILSKIQSED